MLVETHPNQAQAILRAMRQVVTCSGRTRLSDAGHSALTAAARHVFAESGLRAENLPAIAARELAGILLDETTAKWAVRFLSVMALVDGVLDNDKIALVLEYATALRVHEPYLKQLSEAARDNLAWALTDMTRQNIKSLWNQPWRDEDDVMALFLPYSGDHADSMLVARHEALGALPAGTLGRGYWEIYKKNGYAFPGDPKGVNAAFARPHDSTHVLSGYDTTPEGEILVSTFTAGMHPVLPMEGHILPVIFSWHLGVEINKLAGSARGALDPERFWSAWVRGAHTTVDLFASDWDFWSHVEEPVEHLRQRYHVRAL
ncbi:MAG TPA: hypothetical protein VIU63_04300 [Nitrospira sp.]